MPLKLALVFIVIFSAVIVVDSNCTELILLVVNKFSTFTSFLNIYLSPKNDPLFIIDGLRSVSPSARIYKLSILLY